MDAEQEAFIKITNLIAEMSWGRDLPSPVTVYFQELGADEPQKVYAVDSKNYEVVFDAIYQMLKKNPAYEPYESLYKREQEYFREIQQLREQLAEAQKEIERLKKYESLYIDLNE